MVGCLFMLVAVTSFNNIPACEERRIDVQLDLGGDTWVI